MNDTLFTDTIKATSEVVTKTDAATTNSINYWMWIAILELVIIVLLILSRKKPDSKKELFKREAKQGDIDFGNIINSSFHVKPLYDELKVKCHPDRFPNDIEKNKIALAIFQEISKNKTNYKKLIELKELAKQKLNINF
ncbi:MAG: molecular chaperone DnaJ [Bacteroidetes bacterium HGW-Bacteroidetes-4]|jgi:hypothetical protein|nr:MAG: molecular chaperone DnaJ [Bacteroidetes bacterium HGW-Bacteroidetes-4]